MPNCDFYAIGEDLRKVLEFVFNELDCRVFELYSAPDHQLLEFDSIEDLSKAGFTGDCKGRTHSLLLQIWVRAAEGQVSTREIELNPEKCNGATIRYQFVGWGLIQLYLGGLGPKGIVHSHTNHCSERRAFRLAETSEDFEIASSWNWAEVNKASGRLNRYIRKLATSKANGRPVLPEAQSALDQGQNAL